VTHRASDLYGLARLWRVEFQRDWSADWQVGNREKINSTVADLDADGMHIGGPAQQAYGAIEPVPFPATAIKVSASENHN
jgi:hypothetical protein